MRSEKTLCHQITQEDKEMVDLGNFFSKLQVKFDVFHHITRILLTDRNEAEEKFIYNKIS